MFKFLNQCFARLRFWKSVSDSWNLLDGATAVLLETLFQNRSRAKHWFNNLNILMWFQVTIISLLTTSCWWRWYNASWWVSIGARFQGTVARGIWVLFNLPFRVKIFTHSKRTSCALPKQRSGIQNVSKQVCTDSNPNQWPILSLTFQFQWRFDAN